MTNSTPNYFLTIPSHILDDLRIDDSTAILFGRIASLSNNKGYCFASNQYLADLTKVKEREVKNRLKTLEDCGYIKRDVEKNGMSWDRKIYPNFNYEGHGCAPRRAQACPIEGYRCAPEQDKRAYIDNNNNKQGCSSVVVVSSDAELQEKENLLKPLGLTEIAYRRCLEYNVSQIKKAIDCASQAKEMRDINAFMISALKQEWEPNRSIKLDQYSWCKQHWKEGQIYNGATCVLSQDSISFYRGIKNGGAMFSEQNWKHRLKNACKDFGIQFPNEGS